MVNRCMILLLLATCAIVSGARSLKATSWVTSSMLPSGQMLYNITWLQPALASTPGEYEEIVASCGDQVVFTWTSNHNVVLSDDACNFGRTLAPAANGGTYRVTLDNRIDAIRQDGEVYFACSIGRHCATGKMIIPFLVDCESNYTMGPGMAPMAMPTAPAPAPAALSASG